MATIIRWRLTVMTVLVLTLAGPGALPASALTRIGVSPPPAQTVIVADPCPLAPQVSFTATPTTVNLGASATLHWSANIPSGCAHTLLLEGQQVPLQGALVVQPSYDTTYKLVLAWGTNGSSMSATTMVSVILPADPLDPTRNKLTIATPSVPSFLQGLRTPNTTVVVESWVTLDLSQLQYIPIAQSVRVVGGRIVTPGKPYQPGPLLYTTTCPSILFEVQGDDVRITGLRIQGPTMEVSESVCHGIFINGKRNVEVDHNEIYGWPGSGIRVENLNRATMTPLLVYEVASLDGPHVHNNYIHHNRHECCAGYGVVVGGHGYALIQANVFASNRHAISGDGSDWSGYRAYGNVVLPGGDEQQFDMHGQDDCWPHDYWCGTAGHDMHVRWNSFLYIGGQAVLIRGTPQVGAVVEFNVFAHDDIESAVESTEDGHGLVVKNNQVGVTAWDHSDACDFDGDGINDRFIATGLTWWFSSNSGQGPWIYLNDSIKRLHDITLGDFNNDGICDVFADGLVSSGGIGPFKPLVNVGVRSAPPVLVR